MKKLVLISSGIIFLFGCGGSTPIKPSISVQLTPSTQTQIDEGQTLAFTASVSNDSKNAGVAWSMAGTGCTGSACGTFTNMSTSGATYNAPASVTSSLTVTITATSNSDTGMSMSSKVVVNPNPAITTTTLTDGTVGTAYSATLAAAGGAGTLTWSLASGSSLPAGLSLSSAKISGTPTTAGTFNFTVQVTDSAAKPVSATQQLSLTIKPAVLTITTTSLSNGVVGAAYSASLQSSGGTGTVSWSVTTGSLPGGLTLSGAGAISGSPTTAGTTNFTVTAKDSGAPPQTVNQALSITVNPLLAITTTSLPNGVVGTAYSTTLSATGGVGTITWSVTTGSLPAGLSMSTAGAISGTPTTAGAVDFTVTAEDSGTPQQTKSEALSITVYAGLTITTSSLPNGTVNSAYSATLQSGGGTGTVTWSVTTGSLPGGLSLSNAGAITGTPTTAGTTNFTVTATDFGTPQQSKSQALSITVNPVLTISTTALAGGTVGTSYSATISASGGTLPVAWTVTSGALPSGLTLAATSTASGTISGIPTATGTFNFTATAKDSSTPPVSVNQQLTIVISNPPLSITTTTLPNGTENTAYNAPLQASGGTPPYTWTVATGSTLPSWLTLSGSGTTWTLSGTPTTAATSNFSLTVTDSSVQLQSKTVALTLTVVSPSACGTGNESALKGQFAFWMEGYTPDGFLGTVGSFTADGNGNITAGYVDDNGAQISGNGQGVQSGSVTPTGSSYSVGSDNRGCATIITPFYTFVTRFAFSPTPAGAAQGTIEEFEPVGSRYYAGTGQIFQQKVPAAVPTGNWVNYQMGEDPYAWRLTQAGVDVYGSGGEITGGEYDYVDYTQVPSKVTGLTGTYATPDPTTGRYTLTTKAGSQTTVRAAYLVSGTQIVEITSSGGLLVGHVQLQTGSLTLSGSLATYASSVAGAAEFGTLSATGTSYTGNLYQDVNNGSGATLTANPVTCSYTIDSYGRVSTSGTSCGSYYTSGAWATPPVYYLTGPNTGFILGASGIIGQLAPQSATSIGAGNYYFDTQAVYIDPGSIYEASTGVATINSSGVLTGSEDSNEAGQANVPINQTLTMNPDGSFSSSSNPGVTVGLVISDSEFVEVEYGTTFPTILIFNAIPSS